MGLLIALLLFGPVDDIVDVMHERERVPMRYRVELEIRQTWGTRTVPSGTYSATFTRADRTMIWRATRTVTNGSASRSQQQVALVGPDRAAWLHRWASGDWEASLRRKFDWIACLTPAQFGIRRQGRDYSENFAAPSTRVTGRERIGSFDCVRVLFSLGSTDTILMPKIAWLSVKHGYYPVRTQNFYRPKIPLSDSADREALERESLAFTRKDGAFFEAQSVFEVEELARVDGAWLPTRCRWIMLKWESGPRGEITLEVVPGSLRIGEEVRAEDFRLDDVDRVLIQDRTGGGGQYTVTGKKLHAIVLHGDQFGFWSGVLGFFLAFPDALVFYSGLLVVVGLLVAYGVRRLVSLRS